MIDDTDRNELDQDDDIENISQPDLKEKYAHLKEFGGFRERAEEIKMIDREVKNKIKSSYSNRILNKHKQNKTIENSKYRGSEK